MWGELNWGAGLWGIAPSVTVLSPCRGSEDLQTHCRAGARFPVDNQDWTAPCSHLQCHFPAPAQWQEPPGALLMAAGLHAAGAGIAFLQQQSYVSKLHHLQGNTWIFSIRWDRGCWKKASCGISKSPAAPVVPLLCWPAIHVILCRWELTAGKQFCDSVNHILLPHHPAVRENQIIYC